MNLALALSTLALRKLVDGACTAVGIKEGGDAAVAVAAFLNERFTDHSQRLTAALHNANERAWKALELSLAGESFWERCKSAVARAEDKAFARQVRCFLDTTQLPELANRAELRQQCLAELRAARKAGCLGGDLSARQLAQQVGAFARFSDPQNLLDAEWQVVNAMALELKRGGYVKLAWLLAQRPKDGPPVLVVGARYFFRRAVEEDEKLARGLTFAQLDHLEKGQKASFAKLDDLTKSQESGFASLHAAIIQQGQRMDGLLGDVYGVVIEVRDTGRDTNERICAMQQDMAQMPDRIAEEVLKALNEKQLQNREVRPGDSLSIRNDGERQLVKQLVARYRALPEAQRRQMPALLNAVGKLEFVVGDFEAAQKDFQAVAGMEQDSGAKAQAHFSAYQVCLQKRDLTGAFQEFFKAVKLDPKRFATFPVGKYQPQRILGAGGFGVVFLCKDRDIGAYDAVKTLSLDDLGRDPDKVFAEAQVLRQLDHPAIIRISTCGFVNPTSKSRPYMVMDYFPGETLEEYVKKHGPLSVEDMLIVARQVAEGLQAAHGARILHRDVKPANLLVRKEGNGWKVKIIDFGLAMPQKVIESSQKGSTAKQKKTTIDESIAGTLDYGAPEQMGRRNDPVGQYSDVYGWAKTCCFALFQTTQLLRRHWNSLPPPLAAVLEECLDEDPKRRIQQFTVVLKQLQQAQDDLIPVVELAEDSIPAVIPANKKSKLLVRIVGEVPKRNFLDRMLATPRPFKFYFDGIVLGEGDNYKGVNLRVECAPGQHTLEIKKVQENIRLFQANEEVLVTKQFTVSFPESGQYEIQLDNLERNNIDIIVASVMQLKAGERRPIAQPEVGSHAARPLALKSTPIPSVPSPVLEEEVQLEMAEEGSEGLPCDLDSGDKSERSAGPSSSPTAGPSSPAPAVESDLGKDAEECARYMMLGKVEEYLKRVAPHRVSVWRSAAEKGLADGQWLTGFCLMWGIETEPDAGHAVDLYRIAANQGHAPAQATLGNAYAFCTGVEQDYQKAIYWLRKAAAKGHACAQVTVHPIGGRRSHLAGFIGCRHGPAALFRLSGA